MIPKAPQSRRRAASISGGHRKYVGRAFDMMGLLVGLLGRCAAMLGIAAAASCGDSRLSPIFAYDASVGDLAPLVDMPVGDTPMDMPVQPPDADGAVMDVPVVDVVPDVPEVPTVTNCPTSELVGYGSGTTGGEGGPMLPVGTAAQLKAAADMDGPVVIQIATMITLTEQIRPRPNKTIEGIAEGAGLIGGGFYILGVDNVIVRRLKISKVPRAVGDAITIDNSRHIWIDHCDLSSDRLLPEDAETYDGLLDITHGSNFVTVSWNKFHDHHRASIVGHSASATAEAEDTGKLIVTYHHNWFTRITTNTPRVRFGRIHLFNNLYEDVGPGNAIISQMYARVLIEANAFKNVMLPVTTVYTDPIQGSVSEKDTWCIAECGSGTIDMMTDWVPDYIYMPDLKTSVSPVVTACAGAKF